MQAQLCRSASAGCCWRRRRSPPAACRAACLAVAPTRRPVRPPLAQGVSLPLLAAATWSCLPVNETLPPSCGRRVEDFEADMANGYLLAELLDAHGLLPAGSRVVDRENPSAKVQNLTICQQPLLDLGVKFSSKIANELMTETKGTAVQLVYQLKLGLENAKDGGGKPVHRRGHSQQVLLGSTLKPTRTLLSKHEAMEAQHFEALVKQQVQDPKQLAQALSLSRYTEHMIAQQQRDEELDQLRAEQYTAMVAQRRQLELSKLHEGSRLMREWQEEGYAKHAEIAQEKGHEKLLRFELDAHQAGEPAGRSDRACRRRRAAGRRRVEATLRRLQSDGARRARRRSPPAPPPCAGTSAPPSTCKSSRRCCRGRRRWTPRRART